MKKTISILTAILFLGVGFAQDEAKAKAILDKASAKTKGYETLTIKFGVTISSPDSDEPISQKGTVQIKGDMYKLNITDQEVYCDGVNITTYLKEDNECYKSLLEDAEEDVISPKEILTIWEKGYKYRYDGTQDYAGSVCDVIFLYPKDPANSDFHTVKLLIDQTKSEVVYVYLKGKDGTNMKYKLVDMQRDLEIGDGEFKFNEGEHPGVECFDE